MRNALPLYALTAAVVVACASSTSELPAAPLNDAGTLRDTSTPTPPDTNAPPDAASPAGDAATAGISVWTHIGSVPRVGWSVVAHDAAGAVLEETTTDAAGKASLKATNVAMVTLLSDGDAFTYTDVRAGDALELSEPTAPQGDALGRVRLTLPTVPAGINYMGVVSACESYSDAATRASWEVAVNTSCIGKSGKVSAFVLLQQADYSITQQGVATPAPAPAVGGTTSTPVAAYTQPVSFFTFSGPSALVNLYSGVVVDGLAVDMGAWQRGYTRGGRWPSLLGHADYIDFAFSQPDPRHPNTSKLYYAQRIVGTTPSVDLGAASIPAAMITEAVADNADRVRPTLRWTVDGDNRTQHGMLVRTRLRSGRTWAFSLPAAAREVRFPALPASLAGRAPSTGADTPFAIGVESTRFRNSADFRQRGMYLVLSNALREEGTELTKGSVYFPSFR